MESINSFLIPLVSAGVLLGCSKPVKEDPAVYLIHLQGQGQTYKDVTACVDWGHNKRFPYEITVRGPVNGYIRDPNDDGRPEYAGKVIAAHNFSQSNLVQFIIDFRSRVMRNPDTEITMTNIYY